MGEDLPPDMAVSSRFPTAALAAALLVVCVWPIATRAVGPIGDAALFHLPYQMLVGDFARAGQLLLWNPWTNGGSPDGAEPQIGAFSPLAVAAGFVGGGTSWSFVLLWLGTWCLSAAGFARLARHLGAPTWAQVALALAWCTNGVFVGHAGHTCFVHAFAFLPWMVLGLEQAFDRSGAARWRGAVNAGAWWGLSALAGYPGLVIVCGLWLLAHALMRVVAASGERRVRALTALRVLVATTAAAVVVLSPSYAAFFVESSGFSGRSGALPRDVAIGANALEPRALWTVASPLIAPAAVDPERDPFALTDPTSVGLDAGLGTWLLALMALGSATRRRERFALALVGLVFLGLALGATLPLRGWLYDLVPPTRWFRHAAFFRVGFLFALALLAVHGARDLDPRRLARVAPLVGLVAALATAGAFSALDLWPSSTWVSVAAIALPLAAGLALFAVAQSGSQRRAEWAVAALVIAGAWIALRVGAPLLSSDPSRMRALDAQHVAELELGPLGFDRRLLAPTIPEATVQSLLTGDRAAVEPLLSNPVGQLFDSANLPGKVAVLAGYTALNNNLHHSLVAHRTLLHQALGRERVFFATEALHLPGDDATFEPYAAVAASGSVPLLVHDGGAPPDDPLAAAERARLEAVPFDVLRYAPRHLEIELREPRDTPGWLFVTERYAAGWRAQVDGAEADVERAGFLWRAVALPAGARRVHFHYRPFGWPWLVFLSWGALAAICAWNLRARFVRGSGIDSRAVRDLDSTEHTR